MNNTLITDQDHVLASNAYREADPPLPTVAIVGRPNVGKSTLFNRLLGFRKAIESQFPGTTRDFLDHEVEARVPFKLLDIAGIVDSNKKDLIDEIEANVQDQASFAIEKADLLIFLVDAQEEITHEDLSVAELIRKSGKSFLFACNKCEGKSETDVFDFSSLGLGLPMMISAVHKVGLEKLKENIVSLLLNLGFEKTTKKKALRQKSLVCHS